jgi:hypothetical protein
MSSDSPRIIVLASINLSITRSTSLTFVESRFPAMIDVRITCFVPYLKCQKNADNNFYNVLKGVQIVHKMKAFVHIVKRVQGGLPPAPRERSRKKSII